MKWKLGCADFTFPLLLHEQSLDLIAMLGFDGADIGLFEGRSHLWPSKEFRQPVRSGRRLAKKLADRGLKCADVFLLMDDDFAKFAINHPQASRRRKARDWYLRTLDYASASGSRHVTSIPGVTFEDESRAASWGRCCDELAWRLESAKSQGIVFGIEGHIGSLAPRPKSLERLVGSVPGLTLTLDYTHFTRMGISDREVEPLIRHASHFHVRGARRNRVQTSFEDNTIDYARVLKKMDATSYHGWIGIEYVWIDWEHCKQTDNLSETILFRDYLRSIA